MGLLLDDVVVLCVLLDTFDVLELPDMLDFLDVLVLLDVFELLDVLELFNILELLDELSVLLIWESSSLTFVVHAVIFVAIATLAIIDNICLFIVISSRITQICLPYPKYPGFA